MASSEQLCMNSLNERAETTQLEHQDTLTDIDIRWMACDVLEKDGVIEELIHEYDLLTDHYNELGHALGSLVFSAGIVRSDVQDNFRAAHSIAMHSVQLAEVLTKRATEVLGDVLEDVFQSGGWKK